MKNDQSFVRYSWMSAFGVVVVLLVLWGATLEIDRVTAYDVFGVFGLLAFGLMWSHYISGVIRRISAGDPRQLVHYKKTTGLVVLLLLLAHPTSLIVQLWVDGLGLPPQSYLGVYTEPIMKGALMLGTLSFVVFLLYELHRWFRQRPWWRVIDLLQIVAMAAIWWHAWVLGSVVDTTIGALIWVMLGGSLIASIVYAGWYDRQQKGGK